MAPKILIANRGEIALRVLRACRELGIASALVYSESDRDSLAVQLADEAICIGPAPAAESYLKIDRIIAAAELLGATAIHPGYGFLAENAHFAEICEKCNLTFIGPSPAAIRAMGNKTAARSRMQAAGVPVTPGSDGPLREISEALAWAAQVGYPVLLKASAGGGGKGMRLVSREEDMINNFYAAQHEAEQAFSSGELYLEKYLANPRHVEVQIIADQHGNVVQLGERDCSLQRRHQKLIEESPCPILDETTRQAMGDAAVAAAKAVGYSSAGTIEFLLDDDGSFYFMEMNTRIQVEHPVTEMVTNIDLLSEQILVGLGERLSFSQEDVVMQGHAIEVRINAEDAKRGFAPCPGKVEFFLAPGGPGVRMDSHLYSGYRVPSHYDSLLGKVIVWAPNRRQAIRRCRRALHELMVVGLPTTAAFADELLATEAFREGRYATKFVETYIAQGGEFPPL
jgi:acetyl-CoA carboxylase biotin carboxylase subunit